MRSSRLWRRLAHALWLVAAACAAVLLLAPHAHAFLDFSQTGINVGSGARVVAVGDVNGDRLLDIVAGTTTGKVAVALGRGDGTFRASRRYDGPSLRLVVLDVNKDGRADVVTIGTTSVAIRLGRSDGTLGARRLYTVGRRLAGLDVADVNGDGRRDIITCDRTTGLAAVLVGRGDGTFRAPLRYAVGEDPRDIAVVDVNHDRRPDLIVANYTPERVSVRLRTRDGGFAPRRSYRLSSDIEGMQPFTLAIADVDGDGHRDAVAGTRYQATLTVLPGRGDGSFGPGRHVWVGPNDVTVRELTGDGRRDLVTQGISDMTVTPSAGPAGLRVTHQYPWAFAYEGSATLGGVATGDFDRDGRSDVIAATGLYDVSHPRAVRVFLNDGVGPFSSIARYREIGSVNDLDVADVDGDGRLDVVTNDLLAYSGSDAGVDELVAVGGGADVSAVAVGPLDGDVSSDLAFAVRDGLGVQLADGLRSFASPVLMTETVAPVEVALGDLDGDGDLDLLSSHLDDDDFLSVRLNDGTGGFDAGTHYETQWWPRTIEVVDMNEDGALDVVTGNEFHSVSVFIGAGDGTLGERTDYQAGTNFWDGELEVTDLNGDGHLDVVTDAVAVLLGTGDGALLPANVMPAGGSITSGDLNEDGIADIVVNRAVTVSDAVFDVLLGQGDGTFILHTTPGLPGFLEVGDVDGDGHLDIAAAGYSSPIDIALGTGVYEPVPLLLFAGGATWVNTGDVETILAVRLAQRMRLRVNDGDWSEWTAFAPSLTLPLPDDGLYDVEIVCSAPLGEETLISGTIGADRHPPTPVADWPSRVRQGETATIKYRVDDLATGSPTAAVWISVRDRYGRTVKQLTLGQQPINTLLSCSFRCTLPIGVYDFELSTTDLAGNYQTGAAFNTLTVY